MARGLFFMKPRKKYQTRNKKIIFSKGPIRRIDCDVRRPDGKVLNRQILEHPGCVVIVPQTEQGRFMLVRQYRYPVKKNLWEFPAGGRDPGESFENAACRELMEEIGMKPGRISRLLEFYPTPGVSAEKMVLFLARDLLPRTANKDEDEEIRVKDFSLQDIGRMISSGRICDGKTIIGYHTVKTRKCRKSNKNE